MKSTTVYLFGYKLVLKYLKITIFFSVQSLPWEFCLQLSSLIGFRKKEIIVFHSQKVPPFIYSETSVEILRMQDLTFHFLKKRHCSYRGGQSCPCVSGLAAVWGHLQGSVPGRRSAAAGQRRADRGSDGPADRSQPTGLRLVPGQGGAGVRDDPRASRTHGRGRAHGRQDLRLSGYLTL